MSLKLKELYVKCKNCGFKFSPGLTLNIVLPMDKKSLESILSNNYHRCPKCGITKPYNKEDYFLKE